MDYEEQYHVTEIVDLTALFRAQPSQVVLNKMPADPDARHMVYNQVFRTMGTDATVWSCGCGKYSFARHKGLVCDQCHTEVTSIAQSAISNKQDTWIEFPEALAPRGVLNPAVYRLLSAWTSTKAHNPIRALMDPTATISPALKEIVGEQSLATFGDKFEDIIQFFLTDPKTKAKPAAVRIPTLLSMYKSALFTHHLPALPRAIFPLIQEGAKRTADPATTPILTAIANLAGVQRRMLESPRTKAFEARRRAMVQRDLFGAYMGYINYADAIYESSLQGKGSIMRAHILGMRTHWTMRAVISPDCPSETGWSWDIMEEHAATAPWNRLILPRNALLTLVEYHIVSMLVHRHGYQYFPARDLVRKYVHLENPLIDQLLTQLIAEAPMGGLPALLNRPPTLKLGGIQWNLITGFHPPGVNVTTVPLEPLRDSNADFDGDALTLSLITELSLATKFRPLMPCRRMMNPSDPYRLSDTTAVVPDSGPPILAAFAQASYINSALAAGRPH